ncbi:Transcription factor 25 [Gryllus bimaculatus]|nr:Transcription factor 25 [Gryllus bimaculatus]
MSSRVLRRLQGKDSFMEQIDDINDTFEDSVNYGGGGARRKALPVNPFDVLDQSQSESDTEERQPKDEDDEIEAPDNEIEEIAQTEETSGKKKRRKKKKGKSTTSNSRHEENELEFDDSIFDANFDGEACTSTDPSDSSKYEKNGGGPYTSAISIKPRNLNPKNEMKRIFGAKIVEGDNGKRRSRGGRIPIRSYYLVNPKETWPRLGKTGISMKVEKIDGNTVFKYVHSPEYQKVQQRFLFAVDSLNPDNIAAIINAHPYHVDALIQLSDLCKLNDDLQMAAELNERALYCLEAASHSLFNIALGQCQLDYRRQENRALFICLFKHLQFVGQRACYLTALELCKLLLSLDFDSDPLATVLCIDFYALRCRNYTWLIDAANEWEAKKNLSQLPNFAFSTALAHFLLAESKQTGDYSEADKLLQDALILFPGVLSQLLDKCSIQCDKVVEKHSFFTSDAELGQSESLRRLILLYVHRTYHEWKNPKILPWLEKNVHAVLKRVDSGDPFVKECAEKRSKRYPASPRSVLRHIILSDIKEVTSTIASEITSPILSFDPLPPFNSVNNYGILGRERPTRYSPTLSLFFRSLMPNFNVNAPQGNRVFMEEAALGEAAGIQVAGPGGAGHVPAPAAIGDTLRYSVTVLMDAIGLVLANMPTRNEGDENNENQRQVREGTGETRREVVPEGDESEDNDDYDDENENDPPQNRRQVSSPQSTRNPNRTERENEHE